MDPLDEIIAKRYLEGLTYAEIMKEYRVGKHRVSTICSPLKAERRDLDRARGLEKTDEETSTYYTTKTGERRLNNYALHDHEVLDIRRSIRADGLMNLKERAARYKVSESAIGNAARGKSFSHLNDQEPPISDTDMRRPPVRTADLSVEIIQNMISMRRQDAAVWHYKALADWLGTQMGCVYRSDAVKRILIKHDPSIAEMDVVTPQRRRSRTAKPKPLRIKPTLSLDEFKAHENRYEYWRRLVRSDRKWTEFVKNSICKP